MDIKNRKFIFILGMPRSGTTWIAKTFDSHPDTLYMHEPDSVMPFKYLPICPNHDQLDKYKEEIEAMLLRYFDLSYSSIWSKSPYFHKNYLSNIQLAVSKFLLNWAKVFPNSKVLLKLSPLKPCLTSNDNIVVIKSIESMARAKAFAEAVDNNRIIFILRHPCAHVSSILDGESKKMFRQRASDDLGIFKELLKSPNAESYHLTMKDFEKMCSIERLAWRWLLLNEHSIAGITGQQSMKVVRYEDVCMRPFEEYKALFRFCGLSFDAQTFNFIQVSTQQFSDNYYSVYKKSTNVVSKWETKLNKSQKDIILGVLSRSRILSEYYMG